MSTLFAYIATRTTADPYIPPMQPDIRILARDVSDAFVGLSGGYQMVGELKFFPIQRSVPGHALCDGREVAKVSFPELYTYLGDTQGTPVDPDNFVLPNFIGAAAFDPATVAEPETTVEGTTTSPTPTDPGLSPDYDYAGDVNSGGKWWEYYEPPLIP